MAYIFVEVVYIGSITLLNVQFSFYGPYFLVHNITGPKRALSFSPFLLFLYHLFITIERRLIPTMCIIYLLLLNVILFLK